MSNRQRHVSQAHRSTTYSPLLSVCVMTNRNWPQGWALIRAMGTCKSVGLLAFVVASSLGRSFSLYITSLCINMKAINYGEVASNAVVH